MTHKINQLKTLISRVLRSKEFSYITNDRIQCDNILSGSSRTTQFKEKVNGKFSYFYLHSAC